MSRMLTHRPRSRLQLMLFVCLLAIFITFYVFNDVTSEGYVSLVERPSASDADLFYNTTDLIDSSASDNVTQRPGRGFLVWSPSCRIPDIDPWHESIRHLINRVEAPVCSSLPPLTRVTGQTLQLVHAHAHLYGRQDRIRCCYQDITRRDADTFGPKVDDVFSLSECLPFTGSVSLTPEQQFVMVKCVESRWYWTDKKIYTNLHAIVPVREDIRKKLQNDLAPKRKRMSVLIVGIDSISRLNLIRAMPNTHDFLQRTGWVEMKGYNKMDYNTFPNVMAILTGMNYTRVRSTCMVAEQDPVDNCPFIWKDFSEQGYVTGYGEDEPTIATFNFRKTGFYKTPTDYYLRPFMLAAQQNTVLKVQDYCNVCFGPTLATEHVYKYATDFAITFRNNPYFALFWMNSQSHNNLNTPSALDSRTLKFFKDLYSQGALENTFVVFLSDHGMRWGDIRKTYVGWLEERLPFILMWVPVWYRKLFPKKYSNLLDNREKLTSPFDLHLTLQEVLNGEHDNGTSSCPDCVSWFDEVPFDRSCTDAGVTKEWCTCSEKRTLSTAGSSVRSMVSFVVVEINTLLDNGRGAVENNMRCAELSLDRVLSVRGSSSSGYKEYVVQFETMPGRAQFEATVSLSGNQFQLLGTISRINTYGSQSLCMNDAFLKNFCFCVRT